MQVCFCPDDLDRVFRVVRCVGCWMRVDVVTWSEADHLMELKSAGTPTKVALVRGLHWLVIPPKGAGGNRLLRADSGSRTEDRRRVYFHQLHNFG